MEPGEALAEGVMRGWIERLQWPASLRPRRASPSRGRQLRPRPRLVGPLGGRLPFSLALVGLAVGLTVLTAAMLGALAWQEKQAFSQELLDGAMARTSRLAATHIERFLRDAESAARLGPELVAQGLLDPAADRALERFALAALRAHPHLAWVSYGGRDDRFVGAWRDAAGETYVNRSWPVGARIHLLEDRVRDDGRREPIRRSNDHGYRPHERPYFQLAERQRTVTWTEPYEFYSGGGLGISCVAPLFDASGAVQGVFTVDLSLDALAEYLDGLRVSRRGRVFAATSGGKLVIGPRRDLETASVGLDASLVGRMAGQADPQHEASFSLEHGGERYLGRSVPLVVGETAWRIVVSVPERDYTEPVAALAQRTLGLGFLGLVLVATGGVVAARRLSWPLRRLAAHALRIGRHRRDAAGPAHPRDEIGALAHSLHRAAQTHRDRALVSDLLGRYVNPELAQRWLRERRTPALDGERREVAILMSDLRGFSALSEQLGPEAVFGVLNRYLGRMTEVIHAHGGAINGFIGDGLLVLFGAPTARADDATRAVRCAWAMQEALAALNAERHAHGHPELEMGIGLHAGMVVAGHIGGRNRATYTVVGPVVNRTARMVDLAQAGEMLLSDVMLARVRDDVEVGPARRARVKGVAEPLIVYPLLGLRDSPGPQPEYPDEAERPVLSA
jgi:class 3 adenylate cyclase